MEGYAGCRINVIGSESGGCVQRFHRRSLKLQACGICVTKIQLPDVQHLPDGLSRHLNLAIRPCARELERRSMDVGALARKVFEGRA
jgi:hypothetical protein